jgi:hypothetical protein
MSKHVEVYIILKDTVVIYICELVSGNKNDICASILFLRHYNCFVVCNYVRKLYNYINFIILNTFSVGSLSHTPEILAVVLTSFMLNANEKL